ncbi:unnamed protein product, partial [Musa textilis]
GRRKTTQEGLQRFSGGGSGRRRSFGDEEGRVHRRGPRGRLFRCSRRRLPRSPRLQLLLQRGIGIGIVEGGRRRIGIEKGRGRQVRAEVRRAQVHRDAGDGASVTPRPSFSMLVPLLPTEGWNLISTAGAFVALFLGMIR